MTGQSARDRAYGLGVSLRSDALGTEAETPEAGQDAQCGGIAAEATALAAAWTTLWVSLAAASGATRLAHWIVDRLDRPVRLSRMRRR